MLSLVYLFSNLMFTIGILAIAYDVVFGENQKSRKVSFFLICAFVIVTVITKVGGQYLIFMN